MPMFERETPAICRPGPDFEFEDDDDGMPIPCIAVGTIDAEGRELVGIASNERPDPIAMQPYVARQVACAILEAAANIDGKPSGLVPKHKRPR